MRLAVPAFLCALVAATSAVRAGGDVDKGRTLAQKHCSRCHVVGDFNRHGGIDSTPSFQALVTYRPDWEDRFRTFYVRPPHPVYVRVAGLPKASNAPPYATPFEVTLDDIENLVAFVGTLRQR